MYRQINFRAKDAETGKWVYGRLGASDCVLERHGYSDGKTTVDRFAIDFKTLGQFTGMKDRNGRDIYEGDRVRIWTGWRESKDAADDEKRGETGTVVYVPGDAAFVVDYDELVCGIAANYDPLYNATYLEVLNVEEGGDGRK
jgi:uncharacterized phage protein (TIGR01671 family)